MENSIFEIFYIKELYGNYVAKRFELDKDNFTYLLELDNTSNESTCPFCSQATTKVHQRFQRTIIDTVFSRTIKVTYTSRKFKCKYCNKIFTEKNLFTIGKYKYSSRILGLIGYAYEYNSIFGYDNSAHGFLDLFIAKNSIPKNESYDIYKREKAKYSDTYSLTAKPLPYQNFDFWSELNLDTQNISSEDLDRFIESTRAEIEDVLKSIKSGEAIEIEGYLQEVDNKEVLYDY